MSESSIFCNYSQLPYWTSTRTCHCLVDFKLIFLTFFGSKFNQDKSCKCLSKIIQNYTQIAEGTVSAWRSKFEWTKTVTRYCQKIENIKYIFSFSVPKYQKCGVYKISCLFHPVPSPNIFSWIVISTDCLIKLFHCLREVWKFWRANLEKKSQQNSTWEFKYTYVFSFYLRKTQRCPLKTY